ncbi:hypothetical protein CANCADRAFT_55925 [Tortispora caseinolytica NRRL Y-17796]|uniref:Chaps-domain-containing protein n=1 Tax=Tortispora caseinolytica NRRL Y-17796 TaxID=767744 RepID=A0A1E4TKF1_9ASCO|nr:hypothetical protein CANCADRAFT_55925 [Tortispora caseinolytica NRRL Y-17796]
MIQSSKLPSKFSDSASEEHVGDAIANRNLAISSWKQLGPPDLVTLLKTSPSKAEDETIHFSTGIDVSSEASIAAHLNTLVYKLGHTQTWFGRTVQWKVSAGTYCCYNAFSALDIRVEVSIPGSVEAYMIDATGNRREFSSESAPRIWLETFMSAMLRSLLFADDESHFVTACYASNPFDIQDFETRFLDAVETLFFRGPATGPPPGVQVATLVNNNLVQGLFKLVSATGRYDKTIAILSKIALKEPAVAALVAKAFLESDLEVDAVATLHEALKKNSRDPLALEIQSQFCLLKEKPDYAILLAKRAVEAAPSEFTTWANLAETYTKAGHYEQALLTLNTCPMFANSENDMFTLPAAAKIHLPLPSEGILDEVLDLGESEKSGNIDARLSRLTGFTLKGTFAHAYDILTRIMLETGWERLLILRAKIFVMDEEYRTERTAAYSGDAKGKTHNNDSDSGVSSEVDEKQSEKPVRANGVGGITEVRAPENSVSASVVKGSEEGANEITAPFRNKRLCERWLDNLFMVLYEDLKVYIEWRSEQAHYQSNNLEYKRSPIEWEILGLLAHRLHHEDEAIEALCSAARLRFTPRAHWTLLDLFLERKQYDKLIDTAVRLASWNHRWYVEFSPRLLHAFRIIVEQDGATKLHSKLISRSLPDNVCDIIMKYVRIISPDEPMNSEH